MKRLVVLLVIEMMTIGLAGCGGTSKDNKTSEEDKKTAKYHIGLVIGTTSQ